MKQLIFCQTCIYVFTTAILSQNLHYFQKANVMRNLHKNIPLQYVEQWAVLRTGSLRSNPIQSILQLMLFTNVYLHFQL